MNGVTDDLQGVNSDFEYELQFITGFLNFNGKVIDKKTMGRFMNDLQNAILQKQIRKSSPYAKEIMDIQQAVVNGFNTMSKSILVKLKPITLSRLEQVVETINSNLVHSKEHIKMLEAELLKLDF